MAALQWTHLRPASRDPANRGEGCPRSRAGHEEKIADCLQAEEPIKKAADWACAEMKAHAKVNAHARRIRVSQGCGG
jgi:hypothetical protein